MISTFEKAIATQTRRFQSGKFFMAKAVKRFLKKETASPDELRELGKVCYTPSGHRRSGALGKNPAGPEVEKLFTPALTKLAAAAAAKKEAAKLAAKAAKRRKEDAAAILKAQESRNELKEMEPEKKVEKLKDATE